MSKCRTGYHVFDTGKNICKCGMMGHDEKRRGNKYYYARKSAAKKGVKRQSNCSCFGWDTDPLCPVHGR